MAKQKTSVNKDVTRTFVTQYSYVPKGGKKYYEASQTQPGMATSVKDVMNRAEQGLPIPSSAELAQYGDDPDFIGLEPNMDLVEVHEVMRNAKRVIKDQKEMKSKAVNPENDEPGGTTQKEEIPDEKQD